VKPFCRRTLSVDISSSRRLPVIEHGFTHFRLDILPILCSVRRKIREERKTERLGLDVGDARGAAVPAPVKKLLLNLGGRD
jgi:A/G-specific adenine glycosylase